MIQQVHALPKFKRPREKLLEKGSENLSNQELLALILGSGHRKNHVLTLAHTIIHHFPLHKDTKITVEALQKIEGIGTNKACCVVAVYELAQRIQSPQQYASIFSIEDVLFQTQKIRNKNQEHLMVLYLNARSKLVDNQTVAIGRLNHLNLEPRDVFAPALQLPCIAIILIHNHPSNEAQPSKDDLRFTEKMVSAGKLVGIDVIDHVIVTKDSYYSMRENKLLGY